MAHAAVSCLLETPLVSYQSGVFLFRPGWAVCAAGGHMGITFGTQLC